MGEVNKKETPQLLGASAKGSYPKGCSSSEN